MATLLTLRTNREFPSVTRAALRRALAAMHNAAEDELQAWQGWRAATGQPPPPAPSLNRYVLQLIARDLAARGLDDPNPQPQGPQGPQGQGPTNANPHPPHPQPAPAALPD
jgi:hypothetical protein